MPTPNQICVVYQIWGEDVNRISKVQFDSTKTQISTRIIELHFHKTSNTLVGVDCQPPCFSSALWVFLKRERERDWELKINENEFSHWTKTQFYALILGFS